VYEQRLDITSFPHNWDTLHFTGNVLRRGFSHDWLALAPITPTFPAVRADQTS
jgi:hypothetical protein